MTVDEIKELLDDAATSPEPTEAVMKIADAKQALDVYKAERDTTEAEQAQAIADRDDQIATRDARINELEDSNRRICTEYTKKIVETVDDHNEPDDDQEDGELYEGLIKRFDTV